MSSLTALIAPIALAAGAAGEGGAADRGGLESAPVPVWRQMADLFRVPPRRQVPIERRSIIRVSPRNPGRESVADVPEERAVRFRERKAGKCLPAAAIVGVEIDQEDRLLLFMRGHRLIGASLEKACRARDFYSGFYIERSEDGKLCVDRDRLHSRTGSVCSVSRLRQLEAVED
jgi:hypothetical protein